jgi:hypothetical protein
MKVKRSMLKYCKTILLKMSFSSTLFRKEYRKSLKWLKPAEANIFKEWVHRNFDRSLVKQLNS